MIHNLISFSKIGQPWKELFVFTDYVWTLLLIFLESVLSYFDLSTSKTDACHVAPLLRIALTAPQTILVRLICVKPRVMRFLKSSRRLEALLHTRWTSIWKPALLVQTKTFFKWWQSFLNRFTLLVVAVLKSYWIRHTYS